MASRIPSLRPSPIAFAHRGARAHTAENTLEAFRLALRLGATGLESDVWLTADGVAVLDHDGVVGGRLRRRSIADVARADLPPHIPSLAEPVRGVRAPTSSCRSTAVKDPAALEATVATARATAAAERLWLCHHDWNRVASWRAEHPEVHLVDSTRLRALRDGPERRAAQLAEARIDAVNLHASDWTGGLTTLFHRFGITCFGWDAQLERVLDQLLDAGIDGVYSDHVDRMVDSVKRLASKP